MYVIDVRVFLATAFPDNPCFMLLGVKVCKALTEWKHWPLNAEGNNPETSCIIYHTFKTTKHQNNRSYRIVPHVQNTESSKYSTGTEISYSSPRIASLFGSCTIIGGAPGSVVVKALRYKPEGRWCNTRCGDFLNLPNPSGKYGRRDPLRWPRGTFYPHKLAITSMTSCGRSVGIVRSRTQTMEFSF
jgi:hypothetical protein